MKKTKLILSSISFHLMVVSPIFTHLFCFGLHQYLDAKFSTVSVWHFVLGRWWTVGFYSFLALCSWKWQWWESQQKKKIMSWRSSAVKREELQSWVIVFCWFFYCMHSRNYNFMSCSQKLWILSAQYMLYAQVIILW